MGGWTRSVGTASAIVAFSLGLGGCGAGGGATAQLPLSIAARPAGVTPTVARWSPACGAGEAAAPGTARCLALIRSDVGGDDTSAGLNRDAWRRFTWTPGPSGLHPAQLQSAYALPSATAGAGATVAIVDAYDDPQAESDLATYRARFGLPACTGANQCFTKLDQRGGTSLPRADEGWSREISLDLDMVSAFCPNCRIVLIEADSSRLDDLASGVETAASHRPTAISNSYGAPEWAGELALEPAYRQPGIAITASAGEGGDGGVEYPAASAHVTAVGGTTLALDTHVTRGWSESAWAATSAGCSAYVGKPSWQHDGCPHRTVVDVAMVGDPASGVAVYDSACSADEALPCGWIVAGGTSAGAPAIAAVYALAGGIAPESTGAADLYAAASATALNDIVTGQTGACGAPLCAAGPGYDAPTGLGSPRGIAAFH